MALDIRSAEVILECARRGSLGRAATALNMTQPAVTRMLKRVEASYGVPLFDRTTRGVVPTVYGEALLPYAKLIVSEVASADDVIAQMRGASRGVVRIGGVSSVMASFMTAIITEMRRNHPDVQFLVIEELEDLLLEGLKTGEIDIAVSPERYADDEIGLATPEILHDEVSVFARAGHPILTASRLTPAVLAEQDWALPPTGTPVVREWLRRFHDEGLEPKQPCIVSRSVQVIRSAVLSEDILCWMPLPSLADEVESGELVRLQLPAFDWRRNFRIYRRKQGLMTPSVSILIQCMRRVGETIGHELT